MRLDRQSLRTALFNAFGAAALTLVTYVGMTFLLVMVLSIAGTGRNQTIDVCQIRALTWKGMSLEQFCYILGIPVPESMDDGVLEVSEQGILSLFVPQHEITAEFNADEELTGVHVNNYCGPEENGWQVPLQERPGGEDGP